MKQPLKPIRTRLNELRKKTNIELVVYERDYIVIQRFLPLFQRMFAVSRPRISKPILPCLGSFSCLPSTLDGRECKKQLVKYLSGDFPKKCRDPKNVLIEFRQLFSRNSLFATHLTPARLAGGIA